MRTLLLRAAPARLGRAYKELCLSDRDYQMLQHQSYAACDDEVVRARVHHRYAELVELARELSGADSERIDDFFRHGMALNDAAALRVEDLSAGCAWVQDELRRQSGTIGVKVPRAQIGESDVADTDTGPG